MSSVAGVDGAPDGWAVVVMQGNDSSIHKVSRLSEYLAANPKIELIAIDMPIGLLDNYEPGGRLCDKRARLVLKGPRAHSIFSAPVRAVLGANTFQEACDYSRRSALVAKKITKQAYNILTKIREIDDLLRDQARAREIVREVHPEVSFAELCGTPMHHHKGSASGKEERREALQRFFPELDLIEIEKGGRQQRLHTEDILDACVACWSARRLVNNQGRSLPEVVPFDRTGLPMAIWI